jgi:hypothetical protein
MPLLTTQTTFRRVQTDDPTKLTVFFSIDATNAMGDVIPGPMEPIVVSLTEQEISNTATIVARARQQYVDMKNSPAE